MSRIDWSNVLVGYCAGTIVVATFWIAYAFHTDNINLVTIVLTIWTMLATSFIVGEFHRVCSVR